jgi:UDP-N-acetylglucosamine:LPS N-acetylglucosamine transferase
VLVTGGSLGARRLNEATLRAVRLLRTRGDLAVYHVSGTRDHASVVSRLATMDLSTAGGLDYRLVGFEPAMATVLAASDLVIARAGASTVAELTVIGIASVLVPLPGAPSDHQRRNAELLEAHGAARVLDDGECTGELLAGLITSFAADPQGTAAMADAAARLGTRDAAIRVARLVDEVAGRRLGAGRRLRAGRRGPGRSHAARPAVRAADDA